jgi:hypothetical protein
MLNKYEAIKTDILTGGSSHKHHVNEALLGI